LLRGENFYGRDKEALAGELTYDTAAHTTTWSSLPAAAAAAAS